MRIKALFLAVLLAFVGAACTQDTDDPTADTDIDSAESEDEFTLTGMVVATRAGAWPEDGIPGEDNADEDAEEVMESPAATGTNDTRGGIAIHPEDENDVDERLDDCDTTQDAFVTYYDEDTDFGDTDPDDGRFPALLRNQRVTVEGMIHRPDADADTDTDVDADADVDVQTTDDAADIDAEAQVDTTEEPEATDDGEAAACVLVLHELEVEEEADTDDDGTGTGGAPAGTGEPEGTGDPDESPTVTGEEGGFDDSDFPDHEDTDPIFEGTPSPDECEGQKACRDEPGIGQPSS